MKKYKKLRVYVLMGGQSAEHDVSLGTGGMVIKNLNPKKFRVTPVLITKTGRWLTDTKYKQIAGPRSVSRRLSQASRAWPPTAVGAATPRARRASSPERRDVVLREALRGPAQDAVAFIAMHGPYGEDGTLQGLLELAGIPYTGSGVLASALAMDKALSAEVFARHGISVPPHIAFNKKEWTKKQTALRKQISALGWPLVVKPRNLGSSVGITIVQKPSELGAAIRLALNHSAEVMAQKYIKGREIACGVIDKGIPGTETPLQPTEIIPKESAFFDYRAKYTPGASEEITPPRLPKSVIKTIRQTALACHRILGCSGMSRTDMILEGPKLYVLEANTIPGMTETSLLPQGAKACGISFPQLLERIIVAALNRSRYNRT